MNEQEQLALPMPLKAQHVRRCRDLCADIDRFVGSIQAVQALVHADSEAAAKLGILRVEFCTMRAGAWEIISDLGALDMLGQTEREVKAAHEWNVQGRKRPHDGKMAAANDHSLDEEPSTGEVHA